MSRRVVSLLFLLLVLAGCAAPQRGDRAGGLADLDSPRTARIEPEARSAFFQAERAFTARNYDEARRLYAQVRARYPKTRAAMLSSYRLGSIFYYQENYEAAAREFEAFQTRYGQSELGFDVTYNHAAALYQLGRTERAFAVLSTLSRAQIDAQGARRAEIVYQLLAASGASVGQYAAAVTAYASFLALPLDDRKRSQGEDQLETTVGKISSRDTLEQLLRDVEEPTARGIIQGRLGSLPEARAEGPQISAAPADGESAVPLAQGSAADRASIGVILPLTGKFAAYGKRALDGILLAAGSFSRTRPGGDLQIFVEDSASSAAAAAEAVDELVGRHRVMAILGPISWKEALAVADRAQQLGVANISLTGKEGISEKGVYLFQNALTPRIQIENLVQYCVDSRRFRRFAVLAPDNAFGTYNAHQFWDAVEQAGGRVVAYETYPPDARDFQSAVRNLTGLANPKLRKMEFSRLADYVKEQKAKTGKEPKSRVPPIVDFDALFIPDGPKAVAQIAASLSYHDVDGVTLLGTTEWNSDQLYRRGGKLVEGALFPGGISATSRSARQRDYMRAYTEAYGTAPDLLASQAYEAMELVVAALQGSSSDRNDFVSRLSGIRDYDSPLGKVTFDSTRLARRRIAIYTVQPGGEIVEQ